MSPPVPNYFLSTCLKKKNGFPFRFLYLLNRHITRTCLLENVIVICRTWDGVVLFSHVRHKSSTENKTKLLKWWKHCAFTELLIDGDLCSDKGNAAWTFSISRLQLQPVRSLRFNDLVFFSNTTRLPVTFEIYKTKNNPKTSQFNTPLSVHPPKKKIQIYMRTCKHYFFCCYFCGFKSTCSNFSCPRNWTFIHVLHIKQNRFKLSVKCLISLFKKMQMTEKTKIFSEREYQTQSRIDLHREILFLNNAIN